MTTLIDQVDLKIDKHEEDCEKNFQKQVVTYKSVLSFLIGIFVTACLIVFYVSDRFGKVETRISTIEVQTTYIAEKIDKVIENQSAMKSTEVRSTEKILEETRDNK